MNATRPWARLLHTATLRPEHRKIRPNRAAILFLFLIGPSILRSSAQDTPRVQLFAGYSYLRFDSTAFGFANASNLNGYSLAPAFNITHGLGVVAQLSGQYGSKLNLRDLTFGPQFLFPRERTLFFAHVLIGDARTFVSVGTGAGDTARSMAGGGGMDLHLSPRFAWRVFEADYVHTSLFGGTQNNVRISTGLVYHWHSIKKPGHRRPQTQNP
jgi:hypothetical protein